MWHGNFVAPITHNAEMTTPTTPTSVTHLVLGLEAANVAALDESGVRALMADVARVHNWMTAVRAALVVRLDALTSTAGLPPCDSPKAGHPSGSTGVTAVDDTAAGSSVQRASPRPSSAGAPCPKPTELELVDAARMTEREAARLTMLARLLARFPQFANALRASIVAESHLHVLGRLWHQLDLADRDRLTSLDARLVALAAYADPERFRRLVAAEINRLRKDDGIARLTKQRRATGLTHWVDDSGMVNLRAQYDPERGQRLLSRIRIRRDQLLNAGEDPADCPSTGPARWQHLDALALYDLADRSAGNPHVGTGGENESSGRGSMFAIADTEVIVVIDETTLRERVHAATQLDTGEVTLPAETIRRLACDAGIIPVVLGGSGVALDVGRVRRLATHEQRVALRAMYSTCATPGCDVEFERCQPHHLRPWEPPGRGLTNLDNLLPLCHRHHHAAHEGGWMLQLDPVDRRLTITRPDGTALLGYPGRRQTPRVPHQPSNAFDNDHGHDDNDHAGDNDHGHDDNDHAGDNDHDDDHDDDHDHDSGDAGGGDAGQITAPGNVDPPVAA